VETWLHHFDDVPGSTSSRTAARLIDSLHNPFLTAAGRSQQTTRPTPPMGPIERASRPLPAPRGWVQTEAMLLRRVAPALLVLALGALAVPSSAQPVPTGDPFVQVTSILPGCPEPAPPSYKDTAEAAYQARFEAHSRGERGTSCYQSGRCRLPNSYLYDNEIIPRVQRFIRQDKRFAESSVWIAGQRRWVYLQGCVKTRAQADAMVKAVQTVDDVERVVDELFVPGHGKPSYRLAQPKK
jgi:hypothetical protein